MSAPAAQQPSRERDLRVERRMRAAVAERVGRRVDDPHQQRRARPARARTPRARSRRRGRGQRARLRRRRRRCPSAARLGVARSARAPRRALARPSRARARAPRATRAHGVAVGEPSSRAASSPRRVRRSSTSPMRARLLAAGRERDLGEQVGQPGDDRLGQLAALARRAPAPRARRGRSGRERRVGVARRRPPRAAARRRSIACPSGISCVRHGASRASRSTSRSTVILAIRRQVVSLPPVIVIMPAGGLVQLGLARDVDRLLRVAGRDQRAHAGEGAGQVVAARARCRRTR